MARVARLAPSRTVRVAEDEPPHERDDMNTANNPVPDPVQPLGMDVFQAARWFDSLWNSRARAISADELEWQCTTWGSGRGRAQIEEVGLFQLVAHRFQLKTGRGDRDELIVLVTLQKSADIMAFVERVGEATEDWPWVREEDYDDRLRVAAEVLQLPIDDLMSDEELLDLLSIR